MYSLYSSLVVVYVWAVHMFVFIMSSVMVVSFTIFPPKESACETSVSYREVQSSLMLHDYISLFCHEV